MGNYKQSGENCKYNTEKKVIKGTVEMTSLKRLAASCGVSAHFRI